MRDSEGERLGGREWVNLEAVSDRQREREKNS